MLKTCDIHDKNKVKLYKKAVKNMLNKFNERLLLNIVFYNAYCSLYYSTISPTITKIYQLYNVVHVQSKFKKTFASQLTTAFGLKASRTPPMPIDFFGTTVVMK